MNRLKRTKAVLYIRGWIWRGRDLSQQLTLGYKDFAHIW
jgi:hypothetical protein